MSFNKLDSLFDSLQDTINDCQTDVNKFVETEYNAALCRYKYRWGPNIIGQNSSIYQKGFKVYFYNDGSVRKRYIIKGE